MFFFSFQDYKPEEDPALFQSAKTGRGPLGPDWKVETWRRSFPSCCLPVSECLTLSPPPQNELKTDCPSMCAYKLVTVKFRWWGLQTKVENFIHTVKTHVDLLYLFNAVVYDVIIYIYTSGNTLNTPASVHFINITIFTCSNIM